MILDDDGERLPDFLCCGQPRYRCRCYPKCQFDTYNLADLAEHEVTHDPRPIGPSVKPGMTLFDFSGNPVQTERRINVPYLERDLK